MNINQERIKTMITSRKAKQNTICVGKNKLEQVENSKYLGSTITQTHVEKNMEKKSGRILNPTHRYTDTPVRVDLALRIK